MSLLASRVNWGSVPDWIAGLGSVLAFAGFAIAFIWEIRKRRHDDEQAAEDRRDALKRHARLVLMKITGGNVSQAARLAKRNRTEFYKLLHRHEVDPSQFKAVANG